MDSSEDKSPPPEPEGLGKPDPVDDTPEDEQIRRADSDVYIPHSSRLPWGRRSSSGRRSSARKPSIVFDSPDSPETWRWWKFKLRDWEDDEPQDWWFASIAIPLIAASLGPLANVLSIGALVVSWRQCAVSGVDSNGAALCAWDGDPANLLPDLSAVPFTDPDWCIHLNIASLVTGFVGNFFLLCNFTKRVRYIVALPVTIIMWFAASGILVGITVGMHVYTPAQMPQQVYSQGYWNAVMAAVFYFMCSGALMINMLGYFLGHYPQNFALTDAQRTLILQTMMFFIWLAGGAGVFSALEAISDSGASEDGFNFSYTNALYFCDVTILTIGFGDLYPTSNLARGLLIPYALSGIVMLGLMVSSLTTFAGEIGSENIVQRHIERTRIRTVGRSVTTSSEFRERHEVPIVDRPAVVDPDGAENRTITIRIADDKETRRDLRGRHPGQPQRRQTLPTLHRVTTMPLQRVATMVNRPRKPKLLLLREEKDRFDAMRRIQQGTDTFKKWWALCVSVTAFVLLWGVGAVVFWQCEKTSQGMTYFQGLYFCYVSLLTIGYGDLSPKSNPGRAFFVVWSLIAIPTITLLISHLGETVINNFKQWTSDLADFTVLPKEGVYRRFIESHPKLQGWFERRKEKAAAELRLEQGMPYGPEEEEKPAPPTIAQLAMENHVSHHDLARRLAKAIKQTAKDYKADQAHKYGYEEWVEFTRLIRFTAKSGDEDVEIEVEEEDAEALVEWDWIGEDSPMLARQSEAEFLLERLCESMQRYISRNASAARMPAPPSRPPRGRMPPASPARDDRRHAGSGSGEDTMSGSMSPEMGPMEEKGVDPEDSASVTIRPTKRHATYEDED